MKPLEIWNHYLRLAGSVEELDKLGQRMKVDLEQNETFRSVADELREMWQERMDEIGKHKSS